MGPRYPCEGRALVGGKHGERVVEVLRGVKVPRELRMVVQEIPHSARPSAEV
jgi:hypothetical protein